MVQNFMANAIEIASKDPPIAPHSTHHVYARLDQSALRGEAHGP